MPDDQKPSLAAWIVALFGRLWAALAQHPRHAAAVAASTAVAGGMIGAVHLFGAGQGPAFFGCIQLSPTSRSCETQSSYVTVPPDATTTIFYMSPASQPGENYDIASKVVLVAVTDGGAYEGGGAAATARVRDYANWTMTVLSDGGMQLQDPVGGTTPTVVSSQFGSVLNDASVTMATCNNDAGAPTLCVQAFCPAGCQATVGNSFTDDQYPIVAPAVLSVAPQILATTYGAPRTVTITTTPGAATGVTAATFAGTALSSCSAIDSSHVQCSYTSGSASTSGIVTVTSPLSPASCGGCGANIVSSAVQSVAPTGGPIAGGTSVSITLNAGATGATAATLDTVACTGLSVPDDQHVLCTSAAASVGTGPVAVTSPSSPAPGASWTYSNTGTVTAVSVTGGPTTTTGPTIVATAATVTFTTTGGAATGTCTASLGSNTVTGCAPSGGNTVTCSLPVATYTAALVAANVTCNSIVLNPLASAYTFVPSIVSIVPPSCMATQAMSLAVTTQTGLSGTTTMTVQGLSPTTCTSVTATTATCPCPTFGSANGTSTYQAVTVTSNGSNTWINNTNVLTEVAFHPSNQTISSWNYADVGTTFSGSNATAWNDIAASHNLSSTTGPILTTNFNSSGLNALTWNGSTQWMIRASVAGSTTKSVSHIVKTPASTAGTQYSIFLNGTIHQLGLNESIHTTFVEQITDVQTAGVNSATVGTSTIIYAAGVYATGANASNIQIGTSGSLTKVSGTLTPTTGFTGNDCFGASGNGSICNGGFAAITMPEVIIREGATSDADLLTDYLIMRQRWCPAAGTSC